MNAHIMVENTKLQCMIWMIISSKNMIPLRNVHWKMISIHNTFADAQGVKVSQHTDTNLNMSKKKFEKYIGTETDFQKTCARYLDSIGAVWTHVANERKTSIKRSRSGNFYSPDGNKLKQMGVKKGIQDILIFDPRCGHHGLAIELKVGYNKQSDEQFMWELNLRQCGWKTLCTNSLDEFIFVVDEYFGLK